MKNLEKILKRIAIGLMIIVVSLLILSVPMGSGSTRSARRWSERFAKLGSIDAAQKQYPEVVARIFSNGEWIYGICEDSHFSPWGGTIITRDSNGKIRCFFGHVCGSKFLKRILDRPRTNTLDSVYSILIEFEEYKP